MLYHVLPCPSADASITGGPTRHHPALMNCSLLLCVLDFKVKVKVSRSVVSDSLRLQGRQPTRRRRPWDFPGKNTGVDCHLSSSVFAEGLYNFALQPATCKSSSCSCPHHCFMLSVFFILAIQTCVVLSHPGFNLHFKKTTDTEHLCPYLISVYLVLIKITKDFTCF